MSNFYTERMYAFSYAENTTDSLALDKALAASDRFFAMVPKDKINYQDYKVRGNIFQKKGNDSLAIFEFEKASQVNETAAKELSADLINIYRKNKQYEKLIGEYEKIKIRNGKLNAAELMELGKAHYFGFKNYTVADSIFQIVIKNDSLFGPAYKYRAYCNYYKDNNATWSAFPFWVKVNQLIKTEDLTVASKKKDKIEALKYIATYYKDSPNKNKELAIQYFTELQVLLPDDAFIKKTIEDLKKIK
jgi:tetratricopeptide (TPR) repeat protein